MLGAKLEMLGCDTLGLIPWPRYFTISEDNISFNENAVITEVDTLPKFLISIYIIDNDDEMLII